jgi:hypothetical protein
LFVLYLLRRDLDQTTNQTSGSQRKDLAESQQSISLPLRLSTSLAGGSYSSRMDKMTEMNLDTASENLSIYDKYLSELLDNDLKKEKIEAYTFKNKTRLTPSSCSSSTYNKPNESEHRDYYESNNINEYGAYCEHRVNGVDEKNGAHSLKLLQLEEKEYLDKIITTTTTIVKTSKSEDLYLTFDNACNNFNIEAVSINNETKDDYELDVNQNDYSAIDSIKSFNVMRGKAVSSHGDHDEYTRKANKDLTELNSDNLIENHNIYSILSSYFSVDFKKAKTQLF